MLCICGSGLVGMAMCIFRGMMFVVWCGVVWYGMVWYDMVWYSVIWYGIV